MLKSTCLVIFLPDVIKTDRENSPIIYWLCLRGPTPSSRVRPRSRVRYCGHVAGPTREDATADEAVGGWFRTVGEARGGTDRALSGSARRARPDRSGPGVRGCGSPPGTASAAVACGCWNRTRSPTARPAQRGYYAGYWDRHHRVEQISDASCDDAIRWGRARTAEVVIRLRDDNVIYSAGGENQTRRCSPSGPARRKRGRGACPASGRFGLGMLRPDGPFRDHAEYLAALDHRASPLGMRCELH